MLSIDEVTDALVYQEEANEEAGRRQSQVLQDLFPENNLVEISEFMDGLVRFTAKVHGVKDAGLPPEKVGYNTAFDLLYRGIQLGRVIGLAEAADIMETK